MTYPTPDNLKELTEYLSTYIMEEIGNTTIATPLFEETQAMMAGTIKNGIDAFCGGASPTGLRYEVNIIAENADKPVVFEEWSVSNLRGCMLEEGLTSKELPTLFEIDDAQFRELLEHCARKGYSFYSSEGMLRNELEAIAAVYFK